jgi:hypothetical protein
LVEGYGNIKQGIQTVYEPVTGVKPLANDDKNSQLYKDMESVIGTTLVDEIVKKFNLITTKTTADVNMNLNLTGSNLPSNLTPEIKTAIVNFFDAPEGKSYLAQWITDNNSGLGGK